MLTRADYLQHKEDYDNRQLSGGAFVLFQETYIATIEAQLKASDEEIERLKSYVYKLWQIIDDIDTYGDMAKSNDALFRSLVEKKQKERWKLPITTDGYEIMLKDKA